MTLHVTGLCEQEEGKALVEVWSNRPSLVTSQRRMQSPLRQGMRLGAPVSATLVIRVPDGRRQEISLYDAVGVSECVERIGSGTHRGQPLLEWATYEEVLRRCRQADVHVSF